PGSESRSKPSGGESERHSNAMAFVRPVVRSTRENFARLILSQFLFTVSDVIIAWRDVQGKCTRGFVSVYIRNVASWTLENGHMAERYANVTFGLVWPFLFGFLLQLVQ